MHCSLPHSIGAPHHHHPFAMFFCCSIGVCRAFVVVHHVSLLISIPFCALLLFVMLCWWSLLPLWYVLLVVVNVSHCTCWCSLLFSCCVLLVLIIAPMLCFIGAHRHPLLHFVDVCHGSFIAFYWCLSLAFCCTTLAFDNGPLLCSIDACCGPLVVFYQCSSSPSCYIILVFVDVCMLYFVSTFLTFLFIDILVLCSIAIRWYALVVFCWCSLGFHISISHMHFFLQVCRFGSSSFFHNTSSNIFQ